VETGSRRLFLDRDAVIALLVGGELPARELNQRAPLTLLRARADWYHNGCEGMEDEGRYLGTGYLARDAALDLYDALAHAEEANAKLAAAPQTSPAEPALIKYMTTADPTQRDAAFLRTYAERVRNGTAAQWEIPSTIAGTIEAIANRVARSEDPPADKVRELIVRCNSFLANGGLFNSELMEQRKATQLVLDCRDYLAAFPQEEPTAELPILLRRHVCKHLGLNFDISDAALLRELLATSAREEEPPVEKWKCTQCPAVVFTRDKPSWNYSYDHEHVWQRVRP
jgi:hypothetical protein